jgi:hypothetical protein
MKSIVAELIKEGIATQNEDGSVGIVFSEISEKKPNLLKDFTDKEIAEIAKIPSCILQKKDGT